MRPEIESYIQKNGASYTTKALRQQLINAGHDPVEVDAALQETEAARAPQFAGTRAMLSRFWRWVWALNGVGLLVATIWAFQGSSSDYAGAVPVVLGILLLIGLGISGLIGRALLGRGLTVALLVPLIVVVLLTGTCMAIFGPPTGAI